MGKALDVVKSGVTKKIGNVKIVKSGVVKQILKVYDVVGGITKLVWEKVAEIQGLLRKKEVTGLSLSSKRYDVAANTIGGYSLFVGGRESSGVVSIIDCYDVSFTQHEIPTSSTSLTSTCKTSATGDYILFSSTNSTSNTGIYAYDSSLSRAYSVLSSKLITGMATTTINNYALFGGGYGNYSGSTSTAQSSVYSYDSSLTKSSITSLSVARYDLAATTVGDYALFAGGSGSSVVDVYDSSFTRNTIESLRYNRYGLVATTVGNYALFGGGVVTLDTLYMEAYDDSLTKIEIENLAVAREKGISAITVRNYALFAGGVCNTTLVTFSAIVESYDDSLVKDFIEDLSVGREYSASTVIGNYVLFGGGYGKNASSASQWYDTIDVYEYY